MFKKLGLVCLLLFSGSAHALIITNSINDDSFGYHRFTTTGGAFTVDLLGDSWTGGAQNVGIDDAEIWILQDNGSSIGSLTGNPVGNGSDGIIGLYSDWDWPDPDPPGICSDGSVGYIQGDGYTSDPCVIIEADEIGAGTFWLIVGEYIFDLEEAKRNNPNGDFGDYQLTISGDFTLVPEPSAIALFTLGLAGFGFRRFGRRKQS